MNFFIQFPVSKGGLHQFLAIIEASFNFNGANIPAKSGKLLFLYTANAARRVKNNYIHALHLGESLCYCSTRISRSGYKNRKLLFFLRVKKGQAATHESCPNILKGEGGAMKQFQRADFICYLLQGYRK